MELARFHLDSSSVRLGLESLLRQAAWAAAELACFVTPLSLLMSSVLKNVVSYVLSVLFFGCFRQEGTSHSNTLPWPEARFLLNPSMLSLLMKKIS